MSVVDITKRKWESEDDPAKLSPRDALMAALRDIEEASADHVFICVARSHENGGTCATWMQAGNYNVHGQLGLIERVKFDLLNASQN